jgi:hypothetical protein
MNKAIFASLIVVVSFATQLALAADASTPATSAVVVSPPAQPKLSLADKFKAADLNGDGGLSKDELDKTDPSEFKVIKAKFEEMDTNKDGKVTIGEANAWQITQRYKNGK